MPRHQAQRTFTAREVIALLRPHCTVDEIAGIVGLAPSTVSKVWRTIETPYTNRYRERLKCGMRSLRMVYRVPEIARMFDCSEQHVRDLLAEGR